MNEYLAMLRARLRAPAPVSATPETKPEEKQALVPVPRRIKAPVIATGVLCLDFETFSSPKEGYTRGKMTTEAYVRDPRFAGTCLGYAYANGSLVSGWIGHEHIKGFLDNVDWSNTSVLMHHAKFYGLILSNHYGMHPQYFLDTLSMARAIFPSESASLGSLAAKFRFTPKTVPYDRMNGVHPSTMDAALLEQIGKGAAHDCEITLQLFQAMHEGFPPEELDVIDMTIQMFTNPRMIGRVDDLNAFAEAANAQVEETLAGLGVTAKDLSSNK